MKVGIRTTDGTAMSRIAIALLACLAVGLAVVLLPATSRANTLHLSPTGVDTGTCAADPCASMGFAYKRAQPGDTIALAGGVYYRQSLDVDATKTSDETI